MDGPSADDEPQQGEEPPCKSKSNKSYIVKLEDGSSWRIWPGDIALTRWLPTAVLQV